MLDLCLHLFKKIGESGELLILLKEISSFRKQYLRKQKKPSDSDPEKLHKDIETAQKFSGINLLRVNFSYFVNEF